ncbi:hypothetical protein [Paenibacillus sp. R14(2021)]|uniref:hypothetical protein n=1 Tax=Paenibacillus sp. R14(2021) TaxID=2859228 RepID=UPI001C616AA8|nr:hypothetical protein [Paenibacillus sp. R14(2021)]
MNNGDPTGKWCSSFKNGKYYSHPGNCSSNAFENHQNFIPDNNASNFGRIIYDANKAKGKWYPKNAFYIPWDKSGVSDAFIGCAYDSQCFSFVSFDWNGISVAVNKSESLIKTTTSGVKKAWTWAKNLINKSKIVKFSLSATKIDHIWKRHCFASYKQQIQYMLKKQSRREVEDILSKLDFFNKKLSKEQIMSLVEKAANEAIKKGKTDGIYTTRVKGEVITVAFDNGLFKTAWGAYRYKLSDFGY